MVGHQLKPEIRNAVVVGRRRQHDDAFALIDIDSDKTRVAAGASVVPVHSARVALLQVPAERRGAIALLPLDRDELCSDSRFFQDVVDECQHVVDT